MIEETCEYKFWRHIQTTGLEFEWLPRQILMRDNDSRLNCVSEGKGGVKAIEVGPHIFRR